MLAKIKDYLFPIFCVLIVLALISISTYNIINLHNQEIRKFNRLEVGKVYWVRVPGLLTNEIKPMTLQAKVSGSLVFDGIEVNVNNVIVERD